MLFQSLGSINNNLKHKEPTESDMNIANGRFISNDSFSCNGIYYIICSIAPNASNTTVTWNVGVPKNNKRIPIPYATATGKSGYGWVETNGKFTLTCNENTAYIINIAYLIS